MRRFTTLFALVAVVLFAGESNAQTRFSIEAGPLIPHGDFSDAVDASAWIGARGEYQAMNALGQVANLGVVVQAGYGDLELAIDAEDASASLFAIGAGIRVYSIAIPFFLHGGLEYISTELEFGNVDQSSSSFGPTLGAGFNFGLGAIFVEVEGRLHVGLGADEGEADPRFTTLTAALGLPF